MLTLILGDLHAGVQLKLFDACILEQKSEIQPEPWSSLSSAIGLCASSAGATGSQQAHYFCKPSGTAVKTVYCSLLMLVLPVVC